MQWELCFRTARKEDAEQIVSLINSAYRGETSRLGWTTEADLLDGRRTDIIEIERLMANDQALFLVGAYNEKLLGSILLQHTGKYVELSMLAVSPHHQNQGIGKQLLAKAEQIALQKWLTGHIIMHVIPDRKELIAFYSRRGYRRTGISTPFPENSDLWTPKVANLRLELLEKSV